MTNAAQAKPSQTKPIKYLTHLGLLAHNLSIRELTLSDARERKFKEEELFRLTYSQGEQLEAIALAIRPDWEPRNPGEMLHEANAVGFLHAADFAHMIRALAAYATQPDSRGEPFGRSPDGYLRAGSHWSSTAPEGFDKPRGARCKVHRDFYEPCACCAADAKAERRPDPYEALGDAGASALEET